MKKIIICGDRDWINPIPIQTTLEKLKPDLVIHGCCRGADKTAEAIALHMGIKTHGYPANWEKHGKTAGPIRNRQMLKEHPEIVVAFHTDLKNSKGTKDMVFAANRNGIPVWIISGN